LCLPVSRLSLAISSRRRNRRDKQAEAEVDIMWKQE
jgi:hypothetical protein